VTVESAGVVLSASLRIGIYTGLTIGAPPGLSSVPWMEKMEGGIQLSVFANLAEFITNVSYVPNDPECEIKAVQEFQVALGAAAGMSVAIDVVTWGPVAETKVPIWNTQLAEVCASKGTPRPTPTPATATVTPTSSAESSASATPSPTSEANKKRQEMETTELKTTITHTAVGCASSAPAGCPVSLQQTAQSEEVRTTTITYPSGSEPPPFPGAMQTTIPENSARLFGTNVQSIDKTSGSPTVYTPPPTKETGKESGKIDEALDGEVGGVSKKLIVGVSVGIGGALIIGAIVGFLLWKRKKRYGTVPHQFHDGRSDLVSEPYGGGSARFEPYRPADKKKAGVSVSEIPR
jgi:hypothetical protein